MKNLLRNLAYASIIVASLTAAAHFAYRPASAQTAGDRSVVAVLSFGNQTQMVYLANGEIWRQEGTPLSGGYIGTAYFGQAFGAAGPTATAPKTWSSVKGGAGH